MARLLSLICAFVAACVFCSCACAQGDFPFKGEVNEPDINVRVDSTIGAPVICVLRKGERVKVLSEAYDWYRIVLPRGAPSYIHKDFILIGENDKNTGRVLKDNVNVRLRPDIGSPIVGQINKDETVAIVRLSGDWLKIDPPASTAGWVNKGFINRFTVALKEDKKGTGSAVEEHIIIEGLLKKKVFTRAAPYKLISVSGDLFLISGDTNLLAKFASQHVRITGVLRNTYDDPPIVDVQKIESIQ
jgi:uncharacterized protein YgiM (DUF1202 family)